MESELMTICTGVERVFAVNFCDLPPEIFVRLVGSKMRVVRGVCKSLRALVHENRATLVLEAMMSFEELETMDLPFLFSVLGSPRYEITDIVVERALCKILSDNFESHVHSEDILHSLQALTLDIKRDNYKDVFQGFFQRFGVNYQLLNPNGIRIDTVYNLLMRFDKNRKIVKHSINIFSVAFAYVLAFCEEDSPGVDLEKYIVMVDKIVSGPHRPDNVVCEGVSHFLLLIVLMCQHKIDPYPLGHFAGVSEVLPKVLLALLNDHGTVRIICKNVLNACKQLAYYSNHFIVDMTRFELVNKAFRIMLMHSDDIDIVVLAFRFFNAMINETARRDLGEDVMHDVIRRCQQQVRNVPGMENFLRSARLNPQFARVRICIFVTLEMCFTLDDV
jgi:hypothetical protein